MPWDYLQHPLFAVRQRIAAHFLNGCPNVLDIGAYRTPITDFLLHEPDEITIVDPLIEPSEEHEFHGRPCRVRRMAESVANLNIGNWLPKCFGLVFCGMDLAREGDDPAEWLETVCRFVSLVSHAQPAVLEYPVHWQPSAKLWEATVSVLQPRLEADIRLDLSGCIPDIPEDTRDRLQRRLVVLRDMDKVRPGPELRQRMARILFGAEAGQFVLGVSGRLLREHPGALDLRTASPAITEAKVEWRSGALHVTTPPHAWHYGAFVPLDQALGLESRQTPVPARVELRLSVDVGEIAIGMAHQDMKQVLGERLLRAAKEPQVITLFIPDARSCAGLLVRNGQENSFSAARVYSVSLSLPE